MGSTSPSGVQTVAVTRRPHPAWLVAAVAFVAFYVVKQPDGAARTVETAANGLASAALCILWLRAYASSSASQ